MNACLCVCIYISLCVLCAYVCVLLCKTRVQYVYLCNVCMHARICICIHVMHVIYGCIHGMHTYARMHACNVCRYVYMSCMYACIHGIHTYARMRMYVRSHVMYVLNTWHKCACTYACTYCMYVRVYIT
jgi:hypothetical protein